jgi:heme-degrading monooxygenase HmoA
LKVPARDGEVCRRDRPQQASRQAGEGAVPHVRVHVFSITSGTASEVSDLVQDGMLPIFQGQEGFIGLSVLDVKDGGMMTVTVWRSNEDAEEARKAAADWTAANMAHRISPEWVSFADTSLNVGAFPQ